MRFRHHVHNARYVIKPTRYVVISGFREVERGWSVHFRNHYWDSEEAQKQYEWSDEERQKVENKLMENEDFNRPFNMGKGGLFLDEHDAAIRYAETERYEHLPVEIVGGTCIWTIQTKEGAELCGQPLAPDSEDYCVEHAEAMKGMEVASG